MSLPTWLQLQSNPPRSLLPLTLLQSDLFPLFQLQSKPVPHIQLKSDPPVDTTCTKDTLKSKDVTASSIYNVIVSHGIHSKQRKGKPNYKHSFSYEKFTCHSSRLEHRSQAPSSPTISKIQKPLNTSNQTQNVRAQDSSAQTV